MRITISKKPYIDIFRKYEISYSCYRINLLKIKLYNSYFGYFNFLKDKSVSYIFPCCSGPNIFFKGIFNKNIRDIKK